jgi:hypothetical protein
MKRCNKGSGHVRLMSVKISSIWSLAFHEGMKYWLDCREREVFSEYTVILLILAHASSL